MLKIFNVCVMIGLFIIQHPCMIFSAENVDHGPSNESMLMREFAYTDVFRHPPIEGAAFKTGRGTIDEKVDPEIATVMKNESNCTVFLSDGTWFTTWGQGSHEGHPDQRIVWSVSQDMGKTWTPPKTVQESQPRLEENVAYGIPFVVPDTDRIYVFFFVTANTEGLIWVKERRLDHTRRKYPLHGSGIMHFVYSDNRGKTWSKRYNIDLPRRDVDVIPGRKHGWVNHPPKLMPTGEVVFTFCAGRSRTHAWQLGSPEAYVVHCRNILTEKDPEKLEFKMYPDDYQGIRTNVYDHWHNPALQRLLAFFNGVPEDTGWTFQEMTIIELSNGHWLAVGRCALGAVAYTISKDRGKTWTRAEPLLYKPGGDPIQHPITMCPIAKTSDGRIVLMFTNNDGTKRGARHIWDGDGRTRNPQWFVVGREIPGEARNGGLIFGEPRILAKVDDTGDVNLKTGISMPQFFERNGRYFVMYNINKEHILLDEIPESVLDDMTPNLP